MRTILLLLIGLSCYSQDCHHLVNGVKVPCTKEEVAQMRLDSIAWVKVVKKDSIAVVERTKLFTAIRQTAQSAVGIKYDALSITQIRALYAFSLFKDGAIDSVGKIKPLKDWVK